MYLNQIPELSCYKIGEWSYCGEKFKVLEWGEGAVLEVGKFCSIADNVTIFLGGEHRVDWVTTYPFNILFPEGKDFSGHPKTKGDVIIGHDVWIGQDAMIMSGVKVGNGAVIGAKSVVTKDIPPYGIVAGNPSKLVKLRFSPEIIAKLENLSWWNWDISIIRNHLPYLLCDDINRFINNSEKKSADFHSNDESTTE
ncbi:CatB-related O-acetyltransferase [Priestia aryabhattai]|uniref:CatB-related O-acetyltransferase n=1 Tax=Priestia aryabhattai TaxID=412384 RepID=UPI00211C3CE2|nr:CatB-related O-acetyltransferase [Priestia aryabhattai]MCQ9283834.1 CatB-related O-acetyltransferase [Priestia aryabhattai]